MPKAKGYSLWVMPTGKVYDRLNDLILQLSRKYDTPYFEPHVTLIGEILGSKSGVISKTAKLASAVPPYRIELGDATYLDKYFQCLLIRAKETAEVMKANSKAREIFSRINDPKYTPHLSLMYGKFPPEKKEKIIAEIGNKFRLSFDSDRIHLFYTEGKPKDWCRIREFSLK